MHDPLDRADKLAGMDLYVSSRNGLARPLDGDGSMIDGLEASLAKQSEALVARLGELDLPVTVNAYGAGTHIWPYWERELHASLTMILEALGVPGS